MQLSVLLERFPHYGIVVNAEDLTVHAVNPAYNQLLGSRDVKGLPMNEVFSGKELDELTKTLKAAVRERQSLTTGPILASVDGADEKGPRFVHTVVPIADESGAGVDRIFIYSEKSE